MAPSDKAQHREPPPTEPLAKLQQTADRLIHGGRVPRRTVRARTREARSSGGAEPRPSAGESGVTGALLPNPACCPAPRAILQPGFLCPCASTGPRCQGVGRSCLGVWGGRSSRPLRGSCLQAKEDVVAAVRLGELAAVAEDDADALHLACGRPA